MKYAVWLDGVVLDVDLTDQLYEAYKGKSGVQLKYTEKVHEDWWRFYEKVKGNVIVLSPYNKETTEKLLSAIGLREEFTYNKGKTKPSREAMKDVNEDPLNLVVIGTSPLDLLSARFFDSRIKVVCVSRYRDCSKYSPYLQEPNLDKAYESMRRLKLI
ncbi:MAG: HAD family hydrolase [Candidatus Aramenus sp.]|jgi:predicted HAD superfamily phosphohydrolase YqeG|nr:HAD family hydrolase [Candidatus Aramenus sp.]